MVNKDHQGEAPSIDTPKLAVVGCGYWGKNLVRNFSELGVLRYVVDQEPGALELAGKIAPAVGLTAVLDDVLSQDIDGVAIAAPAQAHYRLARRVLEAGKDCFVEKPLALSYSQGAELVDLASDRGLILMVGHVLEYHPGILRLLDLIRCGALGTVYYIYSNRLSLGKIRREENSLWSFAPHDIAVVLRILGAMPFEVIACGGSYLQPNIADMTVTLMLFDNGVRAHIHVSWLHPFKEQRLVVVGSKKMAVFDDVAKKLVLFDKRVEWQDSEPIPIRGEGTPIEFDDIEPLRVECQAFVDSIASRVPPITDGESGLRVLSVLRAGQRSLVLNGEPVLMPLDGLRNV